MAQTRRPFLSNLFFIIIIFFFCSLTPFSLLQVCAYKRDQLLSKGKTQPTTTTSSSVLSLSLHPHSSIVKPPYKNYSELALSTLAADKARANFLYSKLQHALSNFNRSGFKTDIQPEDLEIPVTASQPRGGYLARIGVGQPSKDFYLLADTGSSIIWLQCQSCNPCFPGPKFNPSESSSYSVLSCASQLCNAVDQTTCNGGNTCSYEVVYGGGRSSTSGDFATETLSFGSSGSVNELAIGCGTMNQGQDFAEGVAAGILGLGASAVGLPSQLKATSFSYCLVNDDSKSFSTLEFNSAPPADSVLVPLITKPKTSYYYVELTGIIIAGELISIPASVYQIGQNGQGGIILDSGTTLTLLPTQIHNSVRDTFVKHTQNLPPPGAFSDFDTCYQLSSLRDAGLPPMSFQFSGDKRLPLKQENYLIRVYNDIYCLVFVDSPVRFSIIGNIQQQGMRVTYDLNKKLIGFSPEKC